MKYKPGDTVLLTRNGKTVRGTVVETKPCGTVTVQYTEKDSDGVPCSFMATVTEDKIEALVIVRDHDKSSL